MKKKNTKVNIVILLYYETVATKKKKRKPNKYLFFFYMSIVLGVTDILFAVENILYINPFEKPAVCIIYYNT